MVAENRGIAGDHYGTSVCAAISNGIHSRTILEIIEPQSYILMQSWARNDRRLSIDHDKEL